VAARAGAATAAVNDGYRDLLVRALRRPGRTIAIAAAVTAAGVVLVPFIGSEFMPPSDEGQVRISGEMEVGTRLDVVDRQTRRMERIVTPAVPEARATIASVGASGYRPSSGAEGHLRLSLSPAAQRDRSNAEVAADLRARLTGQIPGMKVRVRAPQGQFILQRVLGSDEEGITVEVRGFDLDTLAALVGRVEDVLGEVPGITDVDSSLEPGVPQAVLRVDRDKAAQLGLSVRQVSEAVETAVAGRRVGDYRPAGESYRILVQLEDVRDRSLDDILDLTVQTPRGDAVALRNVVDVDDARGPTLIDRKDQQRLVTVTANVAGRDVGSVADDVEARLDAIPRPMGYAIALGGNIDDQRRASHELLSSLGLSLLLVFMVLACQYESLRDPLVVMLSVPVTATGVLVTLWLTDTTLNVQSYIGCIMLGGIVVNNAILLVDQAARLRASGMEAREAAAEAGRRRLRPILMTTLTTILGLLPLALGVGEGAEAQAPLARAVIGGLSCSTGITLVLIPVVYTLFQGRSSRLPE
jgi:HAE1 family hydrophobic/amphiphilic exporter-1